MIFSIAWYRGKPVSNQSRSLVTIYMSRNMLSPKICSVSVVSIHGRRRWGNFSFCISDTERHNQGSKEVQKVQYRWKTTVRKFIKYKAPTCYAATQLLEYSNSSSVEKLKLLRFGCGSTPFPLILAPLRLQPYRYINTGTFLNKKNYTKWLTNGNKKNYFCSGAVQPEPKTEVNF